MFAVFMKIMSIIIPVYLFIYFPFSCRILLVGTKRESQKNVMMVTHEWRSVHHWIPGDVNSAYHIQHNENIFSLDKSLPLSGQLLPLRGWLSAKCPKCLPLSLLGKFWMRLTKCILSVLLCNLNIHLVHQCIQYFISVNEDV